VVVQKVLPSPKLLEIVGFVEEVENKWSSVGEALGIKRDVITEVDRTYNGDSAQCCRLLLEKWLKTANSAGNKWDNIIEACHRNFLHSLATKLKIFFASKYKHINCFI